MASLNALQDLATTTVVAPCAKAIVCTNTAAHCRHQTHPPLSQPWLTRYIPKSSSNLLPVILLSSLLLYS